MTKPPHIATVALIVAAGRGTRAAMAGDATPKAYRKIAGVPMLARTVEAFLRHPHVDAVQVVIHGDDAGLYEEAMQRFEVLPPIHGGEMRQESVRLGLEALEVHTPKIVLVHDAARPFVSAELITRAIEEARTHGAAVPGVEPVDSVIFLDQDEALERAALRLIQTPQSFDYKALLAAHRKASERSDFTDDGAVARHNGMKVHIFNGEAENMKVTTPQDFAAAERNIAMALADVRVGTGFDVHAFAPGDHVVLGGVRIPHSQALSGHSDADVALHAITDAILGALGDGDIGAHFPPSDPKWRGADSALFLQDACARVTKRGGMIAHIDVTIIGEEPKIGPHREAMRARIAEIAGVMVDRVGVKATTSERLGFTGRKEGLAALATVTLRLPM